MQRCYTVAELHAALEPYRREGEYVAFVPTMGNLHAGHLALVKRAHELAESIVASIFVNPLQFGEDEDFDEYPRTLDSDAAKLEAEGVQVLFAPSVRDIYPGGYPPLTTVSVDGPLTEVLCGPLRPGHFNGVATVVNILFNLVRPQVAVFGEKDYQQLAVIRRMVADLGLPIRVVGVPTVREADGLALSSRNQYLSEDERRIAPLMYEVLRDVGEKLAGGRRDYATLYKAARKRLSEGGFKTQYVDIRAADLSEPKPHTGDFVVAGAAHLGNTRLIDNVSVRRAQVVKEMLPPPE